MNTQDRLVTLIGGSGFVGRHVVRALAKRGYRIRVACRRPDLAGHVLPLGTPGQIALVQANLRFPDSLAAACEGAFAVVNLPGVLANRGGQTTDAIHAFGAEAAAKAARASGAAVFVQMSAIGADAHGASDYARSKAEGERRASAAFPGAIMVRPSIIFGPEDHFFNRFAAMARFAPVLPVIGGDTKFAPVFVGDVAEALCRLIDAGQATGKTYELGGPETASMKQLVTYVLDVAQRRRLVVPVPFGAAKLVAAVTGLLPGKILTADQVTLLRSDNVVGAAAEHEGLTLAGLGIAAKSFRAIVPSYLYRYRKAGQFTGSKAEAS